MRRIERWAISGGLAVITLLTFAGVRECGFLSYDDDKFVTANPHVARGLTWSGVRWALTADLVFDSPRADYWEPAIALSRMTDVELFGMRPVAHHLMNLALHATSVVVLFLVLQSLTGAIWRSAVVAALFAVHPLHVESVAWVSERKDVLSGLLFFLTLAAYAGYVRAPSAGRRVLVAVGMAAGLAAKPMLVTVPFVLLLLDVWPARRLARGSALLTEKLELFALSAASVVISMRTMAPHSLGASSLSLADRLSNAVDAYGSYLFQSFWPTGLAIGYPHFTHAPSWPRFAIAAAILIAISVLAIRERARRPFLIVGWCWFLGMLVPVIGLVQVGIQGRADRYMYLPLVGLSMAFVWLGADFAQASRKRRLAAASIAGMVLLALSVLSWRQVSHWRDDFALFSHAVRILPNSPIARSGLAAALSRLGQPERAQAELREALRLRPDIVLVRRNLAFMEVGQGRVDEGAQLLEEGLALSRGDRGAGAELHVNLGFLRARQGRAAEAEAHYAKALDADGRNWTALYNWANLIAQQGRLTEAGEKLRLAHAINPDDALVANNLGLALLLDGRTPEALATLSSSLGWFPDDARLVTSFGRALHAAGRTSEALAQLMEAVRLSPRSADAHFQLGLVLEAAGWTERAIAEYRETLRLDPGDTQARAALRGR